MCIVIDTCSLSSVFNEQAKNHESFKPVKDWILSGPGSIIYGGTKYLNNEVTVKFRALFEELKKKRKAYRIDNIEVDEEEKKIDEIISHRDFDDQHIIALVKISGCLLVCSEDSRSHKYYKDNRIFKAGRRPKVYSGIASKSILSERHIPMKYHCKSI